MTNTNINNFFKLNTMVEFNPDGSIKLPDHLQKQKDKNNHKMNSGRCIKIRKEIISTKAPKSCNLNIELSKAVTDNRFIENIFKELQNDVPKMFMKNDERSFTITIGSAFQRCTTCNSLIGKYREFLDGNIIIEKGQCTFEGQKRNFCYEDYF